MDMQTKKGVAATLAASAFIAATLSFGQNSGTIVVAELLNPISVPNTDAVPIAGMKVTSDALGEFNATTGMFRAVSAGIYEIHASVSFAGRAWSTSGFCKAFIAVNNVPKSVYAQLVNQQDAGNGCHTRTALIASLVPGDEVQVKGQMVAAITTYPNAVIGLDGGGSQTNGYQTNLQIVRLRDR